MKKEKEKKSQRKKNYRKTKEKTQKKNKAKEDPSVGNFFHSCHCWFLSSSFDPKFDLKFELFHPPDHRREAKTSPIGQQRVLTVFRRVLTDG